MNPAYLLFDPAVKFLIMTLACQLTAIAWCLALDCCHGCRMNPAYLLFDPAVKFLIMTLACQLTAIAWCIALDCWESR